MSDRVTANLPSRDFETTQRFYKALGFRVVFKDEGWMIISRGPLEIEFFAMEQDPYQSWFSACIRVDDLDGLYAAFQRSHLPRDSRAIPRLTPPEVVDGLRMFALVDPDGSLLRCIDNRSTTR